MSLKGVADVAIDIHAHLYPAELVAFLESGDHGSISLAAQLATQIRKYPELASLSRTRTDLLDEIGVHRQYVSVPPSSLFVADVDVTRRNVAVANDLLARNVEAQPDRFGYWAALPWVEPGLAIDEWNRVRSDHEPVGAIIPTRILGRPIDWTLLRPAVDELAAQGAPLFMHASPPPPQPQADEEERALGSGLYLMTEIGDALLRVVMSGELVRNPRLRIATSHLGGPLAMLITRIDRPGMLRQAPGVEAPNPPSRQLRGIWYDCASASSVTLACAGGTWGMEQLVVGTDYPFTTLGEIAGMMSAITGLPANERQALMVGNAKRLLLGPDDPTTRRETDGQMTGP